MTRAKRLKAVIPALYSLYWKARTHADEHRAMVLLRALGAISDDLESRCASCRLLTPSEWLSLS